VLRVGGKHVDAGLRSGFGPGFRFLDERRAAPFDDTLVVAVADDFLCESLDIGLVTGQRTYLSNGSHIVFLV
jgi:hypothetical protein